MNKVLFSRKSDNWKTPKYYMKDLYKNMSKEERAERLGNIICNRCKYQNQRYFVMKYGKCHLCGATLDVNYFKRTLLKKLKED